MCLIAVRAVGKFQPKAKARPVKKGPLAAAAAAPSSQSNQLGGGDKCEETEALKSGQLSTKGLFFFYLLLVFILSW